MTVVDVATDHQDALIGIHDRTTAKALRLWQKVDPSNLDQGWSQISGPLIDTVAAAQLRTASSSDPYTSRLADTEDFDADRSKIVPQAFVGVDGSGRDIESLLFGAVTTTKKAIGSGVGVTSAFESGAVYLAAMLKTALADIGRASDMVSASGKGYRHYVRGISPGACKRCAMLAGIESSANPFLRHVGCRCVAVYVDTTHGAPKGLFTDPYEYFESLSKAEQDRVFTKAGAQAIRDGADISKVVSARRGAKGIGYAGHGGAPSLPGTHRVMQKTTIGYRPDGTPVQVYATTEGTTIRGEYGRQERRTGEIQRLRGARYQSVKRVRLMPEEIMKICGDDVKLQQAFLRDAGYLRYIPPHGYDAANKWIGEIEEMRRQDRILVNRATLAYGNFILG